MIWFTVILVSCAAAEDNSSELNPAGRDKLIVQMVANLLEKYHYSQSKVDDSISRTLFDEYFAYLDPNRYFFLASDIEEFSSHKDNLDNELQNGDITFAFDVYKRFLQRIDERAKYVQKHIGDPFDFTRDETMLADRSEAPWAKDSRELDEIWRKNLKNQLLQAKLKAIIEQEQQKQENGDKAKTISEEELLTKTKERIVNRYQRYYKLFSQYDNYNILEIYLSTLAGIFDPHSSYLNWRTLSDFDISFKLSLQGIGAAISYDDGYPKIERIIPGGPADKQGQLKVGYRIISVTQSDGTSEDVVDMPLSQVVQKIRGEAGTKVTLTVIKTLQGVPFDITITRGEVKLTEQAAKGNVREVILENGQKAKVGIIHLPSFYTDFEGRQEDHPEYRSTVRDVKRILDKMEKEDNISGVLIDLRSNGGGSLEEVIDLAGLFIPSGPIVQVNSIDGKEVRRDKDNGFAYKMPLAVMVNAFSASASEIFAATIQDYDRGIIVGGRTHGKGTVQSLLNLSRIQILQKLKPGALKCTIAKFYRVTGASTQKKGVVPDILLPSFNSAEKYGEASHKHVMPWDEISGLPFRKSSHRASANLQKLSHKYQARVENDPRFQQLTKDIERWNERKDEKTISLRLEDRLTRQREEDEWYKSIEKLLGEPEGEEGGEKKNDLYLEESIRILTDFISQYRKN